MTGISGGLLRERLTQTGFHEGLFPSSDFFSHELHFSLFRQYLHRSSSQNWQLKQSLQGCFFLPPVSSGMKNLPVFPGIS